MSEHRKNQFRIILNAVKLSPNGITRLEVSRLLEIPKTYHVTKLLKELVEAELLYCKSGVDGRRRNVFTYYYNEAKGTSDVNASR